MKQKTKKLSKNDALKKLLDFHVAAEKLKTTARHSWLSDPTRQESVAEHSWMLGLMAILWADELNVKIDLLKVLKMLAVHDLAEAVTGDIPSHEVSARQKNKHVAEKIAFKKITFVLPKDKSAELLKLWNEFEAKKTHEAQFANALDKIEAVMQHNIADIQTWDQGDFTVHPYYKDEYFNFDAFMRQIKDAVDDISMQKIIGAKAESRIEKRHLDRYEK